MGFEITHPTPSHSPQTSVKLNGGIQDRNGQKWPVLKRANSPSINESYKNWRPVTSKCNCALSILPLPPLVPLAPGEFDIPNILHYAHIYGDFAKAHDDFEMAKDKWTPAMFGHVLKLIEDAGCYSMDIPLRSFHQAIRNNGLWTDWIDSASKFPRYETILLEELAAVIENLSPKYLKDIKIEHLLKIFPSANGQPEVQLHGKKRKLKRQVLKWCETQSEAVLNKEWVNINILKWRLQKVIDIKDREMEDRQRQKLTYNNNWRSNSSSPVAYATPAPVSTVAPPSLSAMKPNAAMPVQQQPRFSLADKASWPTLQANWNSQPNESRLVMGM